jgi:U6 snRNA-associated Sm-like protein LSm7
LDKDRDREKKKKETILDLSKYLDKPIRVKFSGGREGKFNSAIFKLFLDLFL